MSANDASWKLIDSHPDDARELAESALTAARQTGDRLQEARALSAIGAVQLRLGDHEAAAETLGEAIELLSDEGAHARPLAEACMLLARCRVLQHRGEDAIRLGSRAMQVAGVTDDADLTSRALNQLGSVYGVMAAYPKALDFLLESASIRDEAGLTPLGGPLNNIGNIHFLQAEHGKALAFFERSLAAFRAVDDPRREVIALGNVGRSLEALGRLEDAKIAHEEAVRTSRVRHVSDYEAPALAKLARTLTALGQHEKALAALEEAKAIVDERGTPFADEIHLGLARLHLDRGDGEAAERAALEVLALAESTGNPEMELGAHGVLWRVYEHAQRWRDALGHHKRFHELEYERDRDLFSSRTRALQVQHEVDRAQREESLLRFKNEELTDAYGELRVLHDALQSQAEELERLSHEDSLTRLPNRRSLEKRWREEQARIERYGGRVTLLVCDIDDFKVANDVYSHAVGDLVLEQIGRILRKSIRDVDVAARFGGEEFVLMLPETTVRQAEVVAEKIRSAVEAFPWSRFGEGLAVTMSIGVAEARPGVTFGALFSAADAQLYRAKAAGKNRVRTAVI